MKMQVRANPNGKIGTCGCGRSPTGDCCGWHGLSEDDFRQKLAEWQEKNMTFQKELNKTESIDGIKDLLEGTDGDGQD
jgi:hypothetical protein